MNDKEPPNFVAMALSPDVVPESTPSEVVRKVHNQKGVAIEYALWKPPHSSDQCAIALHGFSRPLEDMLATRPLLPDGVALLMPHLPAHGRSSGHHRPLEIEDWTEAMKALLNAEGLEFSGTLIGYSLGGRLALTWFGLNPTQFSKVMLLAPDGLVKNPGYRLSVDTTLGRAWLGQSEKQRNAIVRMLTWWRARGILPEHFYQFSLFHLASAEMWAMVVDCWCSLRKFWPPKNRRLQELSKAHPGILEAHFGARDKVIKPANARALNNVCPVHFHPCGHGLLRPDIIERIASPS